MPELIIAEYRDEMSNDTEIVKYKARIGYIHGNSHPSISITGTTYERFKTQYGEWRWEETGCGCVHTAILAAFPGDPFVALMVALHLSDFPSGAPMHSVENGFYWYRHDKIEIVAKHLRLPLNAVKALPAVETKDGFNKLYVEPQRARWAQEALTVWETFKALGAVNERGVGQLKKYYGIELPN